MNENARRKYSLLEHLLFPPKRVNLKKLENAVRGKTILITGASFGIGAQVSSFLAFQETHLILVGRTASKLDELQKKIEASGGNAEVFYADLRVESQIDAFIAFLLNKEKGVDIFISNAGKSIRRSVLNSLDRFHDYSRTMDINYFAPVKLSLALIPILALNKGHVINVSALNVLLEPMPNWSAYQASKTAFDQWFRSVSPELNHKGITTTTLYLPLVKTRMIAPTKSYEIMPAMNTEHVARIVGKLILNRKSQFKPWWTVFMEAGSLIFRKPIKYFLKLKLRKHV